MQFCLIAFYDLLLRSPPQLLAILEHLFVTPDEKMLTKVRIKTFEFCYLEVREIM